MLEYSEVLADYPSSVPLVRSRDPASSSGVRSIRRIQRQHDTFRDLTRRLHQRVMQETTPSSSSSSSSEEVNNDAAESTSHMPVPTATPMNSKMLAELFHRLPTSNCESNSDSPPTTPPCSSTDKTDNRDSFGFCPNVPDMRREEERLKTFDNWPVPFLMPDRLARNGFYYLGKADEVRCAFCKVEIMRWVEGDDPARDHQRWAPQCPFLRHQCGNVPMDPTLSDGHDECGVRPPAATTPVQTPRPAHPHYASEAARLRTFTDWPRSMRQKPEELAEAGFFYTGQGDKTKCYFCDGGLKDWENDDVPWEQHARWFDRCPYVQIVKGRDYVQKVISEACAIPAPKPEKEPVVAPVPAVEHKKDATDKPIEDTKLCKICFVEERNVCFLPCGHLVACAKCALSVDKCPMCRRTFTNVARIYLS